jgi:hypothetical protein
MRPSKILRQAVDLFGSNAPAWFAAAALFTVPVALAGPLSEAVALPFWQPWSGRGAQYVLRFIEVVAHVVTAAVLVLFALRARAGRRGGWSATWNAGLGGIRPALTASLAVIWPLIGYMFLAIVPFIAVGMVRRGSSFSLPGAEVLGAIYLAALVSLVSALIVFLMPVAMLEKVGGRAAYRRNRALLAGNWRLVLQVVMPIAVASQLLITGGHELLPADWMGRVARQLIEAAFLPLKAAASVLLYLEVRAARESRDVEELTRELDQAVVQGRGQTTR